MAGFVFFEIMRHAISIVIPSYHRNNDLAGCLRSIRQNSFHQCEIIVMSPDNGFEIVKICAKYKAELENDKSRVKGKREKSLWAIINQGIERASTDYVAWLNDDCKVNPGWDRIALSYFQEDVGIVVLRTKGINQDPNYGIRGGYYNVPVANYAILRKDSRIRFDENFSWFYGDADISLQMAYKTDLRVVATCENLVIHEHRIDDLRKENEKDKRSLEDHKYFEKKWRFKKQIRHRICDMNLFERLFAFLHELLRESYHWLRRI
jgi:glycosyltransferase involved in cell wall biosynthesis